MRALRLSLVLVTIALASLGAFTQSAQAADAAAPEADKIAKARAHFLAARDFEKQEKHVEAAAEYRAAHALTGDPILHYKIAEALEKLGDLAGAVTEYRLYLAGKPNAKDRDTVTAHADALDAQIAANAAVSNPPAAGDSAMGLTGETGEPGAADETTDGAADNVPLETAVRPEPVSPSRKWRTAGWISAGVTVAMLTTGGVLALSAKSRQDDVNRLMNERTADGQPLVFSGSTRSQYEQLQDEGDRLSMLSKVFFIAGGVATAATVTFFVLDATGGATGGEKAPAAEPSSIAPPVVGKLNVQPLFSPTFAGVNAGFSF